MGVHLNTNKNNISKDVIICGDPLRVKFIAENYLTDAKLVNKVRLALTYTGYYKNHLVTITTSGMGMPSMAIYAYELFNDYDVDKIIRVGSCGSYYEEIGLKDIILVEQAFTLSNFSYQYNNEKISIVSASKSLNGDIIDTSNDLNIPIRVGNINTSDIFYTDLIDHKIKENYCLGVEMETFALFYLANKFNKKSASILSVSDNIITKEKLSSEERETSFKYSICLALESLLK